MTMSAQYRPYRNEEGIDGLDIDHLNWSEEPGTIQIYEKTTEDLPFNTNRRYFYGTIMLSLLTLMMGFLIGYFAHNTQHADCALNTISNCSVEIASNISNMSSNIMTPLANISSTNSSHNDSIGF